MRRDLLVSWYMGKTLQEDLDADVKEYSESKACTTSPVREVQAPDDDEDAWDVAGGLEESLRDTSTKVQEVGQSPDLGGSHPQRGNQGVASQGRAGR